MREVPEWVGQSDDDPIPPRVRLRVYFSNGGRCYCCSRLILVGEAWAIDHVIALANGGQHAESNLRPILVAHHVDKTRKDVAAKSKSYRVIKKHLGLKKAKRPMPGSRASGWKRKMDGSVVKR